MGCGKGGGAQSSPQPASTEEEEAQRAMARCNRGAEEKLRAVFSSYSQEREPRALTPAERVRMGLHLGAEFSELDVSLILGCCAKPKFRSEALCQDLQRF